VGLSRGFTHCRKLSLHEVAEPSCFAASHKPAKDGGQAILKTRNTLEVEGSDKPALVAEMLAFLIPAKGGPR